MLLTLFRALIGVAREGWGEGLGVVGAGRTKLAIELDHSRDRRRIAFF